MSVVESETSSPKSGYADQKVKLSSAMAPGGQKSTAF